MTPIFENCFGSVSQEWLARFLEHRIGDKRIIRLIQKWLRAGILEDGIVTVDDRGTGQGSVISPLLANIYLHYVLTCGPSAGDGARPRGDMIIVRYADDLVVGFEHEGDARRFLDAMRERFEDVCAGAPSGEDPPDRVRTPCGGERARSGFGKPETFKFLGFTFICGKTRRGKFRSRGRPGATACGRNYRKSRRRLRRRRHQPIPVQGKWLKQVVTGHFAYYAVPTNSPGARARSGTTSPTSGDARFGDAARRTASPGTV